MVDAKSNIGNRIVTAIIVLILLVLALLSVRVFVEFIVYSYFSNLSASSAYITEAIVAIIACFGAYVIYRVAVSILRIYVSRHKIDEGTSEILKLALRIILYAIIFFIVLTAFGVNLSDALAGGAIGGIVLGLAVQTVASSILSGFLVSTSRAAAPGNITSFRSSYWGSNDVVGRVTKVSTLYTDILTQNGNTMRFPNTLMLSYVIITQLKVGDIIVYPLQITLNSDAPTEYIHKTVQERLEADFASLGLPKPAIYETAKASSANTFTAIIYFKNFSDFNMLVDKVNSTFDAAYFEAKQSLSQKPQQPAKPARKKGTKVA